MRRAFIERPSSFRSVPSSAGVLLDELDGDTRVVYLCGDAPAEGWGPWALDGLPAAWTPGQHYLDASAPVLRYEAASGRKVDVQRAAPWFGTGDYTPAEAEAAWALLKVAISSAFAGGQLLATPATTGRELFARTIPLGREWPVLDDELQELIRSTSGQGRTEVVPSLGRQLPALYEYDGRLMYAALCRELPAGVPTHDAGDGFLGYQRARYRVRATVPRDWPQRFGLLGVKREDSSRLWEYPAEPGRTFATWCDGAELSIALRAGWDCRILERLYWPRSSARGPLDTWAQKLVAAREGLLTRAIRRPEYGIAPELAAGAVRAIVLHGIGAFHGRPQTVTRYLTVDDAATMPADASNPRVEGSYLVYEQSSTSATQWRRSMSHPEWPATIWARARARLLVSPLNTGALNRTAGEVVGFRTDALYLTAAQPWADDGAAGRFRLKRVCDRGPYPWPRNGTELVALRDTGREA